MDYEWKILVHEKELAHLREMQELSRGRLDAHDSSIAWLHKWNQEISEKLKETADSANRTTLNVEAISIKLDSLSAKVDALVSALLREHPNGH